MQFSELEGIFATTAGSLVRNLIWSQQADVVKPVDIGNRVA